MGVLVFVLIIMAILIWSSVVKVPSGKMYVVERMGKYHKTIEEGIYFCLPILDRVSAKLSIGELTYECMPQPVISQDNIIFTVRYVFTYHITDARRFKYAQANTLMSTELLLTKVGREILDHYTAYDIATDVNKVRDEILMSSFDAAGFFGIGLTSLECYFERSRHD